MKQYSKLKSSIASASYEYVLITLPVAFYVAMEALHKKEFSYFIQSPEWSIATIFLCFQAIRLYILDLSESGKKFSDPKIGLVALTFLTVIVASTVNTYLALHHNTTLSLFVRLSLFIFITIVFFSMVSSAKLVKLNDKE